MHQGTTEWQLQRFSPDHDRASAIHGSEDVSSVALSVDYVNCFSESPTCGTVGLSECRYETVVTGHNAGYYTVPRTVSLAELADDVGVTHQALSERLRRAHRTLSTDDRCHRSHHCEPAVAPRCTAKTISDVSQ